MVYVDLDNGVTEVGRLLDIERNVYVSLILKARRSKAHSSEPECELLTLLEVESAEDNVDKKESGVLYISVPDGWTQ